MVSLRRNQLDHATGADQRQQTIALADEVARAFAPARPEPVGETAPDAVGGIPEDDVAAVAGGDETVEEREDRLRPAEAVERVEQRERAFRGRIPQLGDRSDRTGRAAARGINRLAAEHEHPP